MKLECAIVLKTANPEYDHCTLVYAGQCDYSELIIINDACVKYGAVRRRLKNAPISAKVIGTDNFGPFMDIPVLLLEPTDLELASLPFKRFSKSQFKTSRPHITVGIHSRNNKTHPERFTFFELKMQVWQTWEI